MDYDLLTVGRCTMDLIAQDIGVPFEEVSSFGTSVGGSPTNIAIGAARLGLRPVAFSGVGDDLAGDFVLHQLAREGVETRHVARVPGFRTALAMVAVQPPDRFPLSFYREDPADIHLTVEDAEALPFDGVAVMLLSGNAFSRGTCADAARYCADRARSQALTTYLDLDLRPTEWAAPGDYGATLRPMLSLADVVLGTEEEFYAVLAPDVAGASAGRPLSDAERTQLEGSLADLAADVAAATLIVKRGPRGVTVMGAGDRQEVPAFDVDAVNTVGAGDAFAAGLIRGRSQGWDWDRAVRYAHACGAIQVTRHGCSAVFPAANEVDDFIDRHGGR